LLRQVEISGNQGYRDSEASMKRKASSTENTKRIIAAAKKWADFMECRLDKFKWSQPERRLYNAITSRKRRDTSL